MYEYAWARPDDDQLDRIVALVHRVSQRDPFIGLPPGADPGQLDKLRERLAGGLRSGGSHILTVTAPDGSVVGCVVLNRALTPNQRHIAELTTGAVDPEHRGQKLVTRAFAEVVRRCEEHGVELLRLDVREGIKAEKLWRSYGFAEYGRLDDYGRVDGVSYAGIYLAQPVQALKARVMNMEAAHAQ